MDKETRDLINALTVALKELLFNNQHGNGLEAWRKTEAKARAAIEWSDEEMKKP
jgi:hypothetical protein